MNHFVTFGVNSPSPFGVLPEGTTLRIGPDGINLILSFSSPKTEEIKMVRKAPLTVGLARAEGIPTALLVWRLAGANPLMFDTPFNVCIDPRPEMWALPDRLPYQHLLLTIVLQDAFGIVKALRGATIPPTLMEAIEAAVADQVAETRSGRWTTGWYHSEIAMLYRRWPLMDAAMRDAIRADLGK
ncbi:hypothetical protein [Magnetospirillum sp. SS-4]|uniref:hypothetical protein n=1 Tax=Magnetospirillum sp. SS-4 TaxID=2681465 RepID=UPI00138004E7|nr:hypothetical protein [Magnetospirillum sp. SS-4]CAA7619057.1 hypothetical protein MTBSS4_230049 [Magnetospirillum sp. SS-4]